MGGETDLIISDDYVNDLISAGLTSQEAKVFLSLVQLGSVPVSKIAQQSNIDRSNVYRTLKKLEEKEIVRKELGKSTTYGSVPLPLAIEILINGKKREYNTVLENLKKLAKQLDYVKKIDKQQDFFKILPSGSQVFCRNWEKTLLHIKKSVDVIATEKREPKNNQVFEIYQNLLQDKVRVRWIFDRSFRNDNEFAMRIEQIAHLLKYPTLEIRFSFDSQKPYGAICDNQLAIICLDSEPPIKYSRTLWTNNEQILLNFKEHFNSSWENATTYEENQIVA
ncbi:MAG: hypothetical protein CW691_05205 [Candidatus Bathyarchaeum sp.]|nr:MAG: hypothetical protein CW691_05205 [Candidatus Bathyarchaeum sp.]